MRNHACRGGFPACLWVQYQLVCGINQPSGTKNQPCGREINRFRESINRTAGNINRTMPSIILFSTDINRLAPNQQDSDECPI
ncbi:hypothetical protein [Lentibacillus juripiscarius]|uniref:hypothetical protein n=1 Tax=Lentibacillus juripiscarius TaxID=257446 RepID=UPI0036D3B64C